MPQALPSTLHPSCLTGEPPLRAWPASELPRERLRLRGARELADAELLALLLRNGTRGATALGLARRLQALAQARGGLTRLDLSDFCAIPGLGIAKAASILAALELGRRQALQGPLEAPLAGPGASVAALRGLLDGRAQEHFAVLALDARRRILAAELVSRGTLTQAMAHPREVFRSAIKLGAAAVVVGHNHPSGDPAPSPDDHAVTRRLRQAAELLGVPLLDHVIVGQGRHYSYAEAGWP
jgi:DNA repair protein RadC